MLWTGVTYQLVAGIPKVITIKFIHLHSSSCQKYHFYRFTDFFHLLISIKEFETDYETDFILIIVVLHKLFRQNYDKNGTRRSKI